MAKVFRSPIPAPEFNIETWQADEAAYIQAVKDLIPKAHKGEFVGEVIRFPKGDGYARYLVWSQSPLELIWLEIGDKWQADIATLRGLRLSDVETQVRRNRFLQETVSRSTEFYDTLPVGAIVHYDNGFASFVRAVRVEGEKGHRLKPLALVGNWQAHDLPKRERDGSIRYGYQVERIREGKTFEPSASCIWENMDEKQRAYAMRSCKPPGPSQTCNFPKYEAPFDPTTAETLSLELPEPTLAEQRLIFHEKKAERLREALQSSPPDIEGYKDMFRAAAAILLEQET